MSEAERLLDHLDHLERVQRHWRSIHFWLSPCQVVYPPSVPDAASSAPTSTHQHLDVSVPPGVGAGDGAAGIEPHQ